MSAKGSPGALSALFAPRSVAVVGASHDPTKWGNWLAAGALRGRHRRTVHLVNRKGGKILGQPVHCSLQELPDPTELVLVCVPARAVPSSVEQALGAGAKAVVVISAGESEAGAPGGYDQQLAESVKRAGAVLLGPNCLGVFDAANDLELVPTTFPRGPVGMISQSGNLALEAAARLARLGLGFSRFASIGNQAHLTAEELLPSFIEDDATRLITLYIEDFRDGRAFVRAARASRAAGKPVILLSPRRSDAAQRSVWSHTASHASTAEAITAACQDAGIYQVADPSELVDMVQGLLGVGQPRGKRLVVLADGGGHAGIASTLAHEAGLGLPALSPTITTQLRQHLPPTAGVSNPIDLAGGGEQDLRSFDHTASILLHSEEVDALLITGSFGGYGEYADSFAAEEVRVADALADAAHTSQRPLIVQTMYPDSAAAAALRRRRVPVYHSIQQALNVLVRRVDRAEGRPHRLPGAVRRRPADGVAMPAWDLLRATSLPLSPAGPRSAWEHRSTPAADLRVRTQQDLRFGAVVTMEWQHAETAPGQPVTALAPFDEADALELLCTLAGSDPDSAWAGHNRLWAARVLAELSQLAADHPTAAVMEFVVSIDDSAGPRITSARMKSPPADTPPSAAARGVGT